MYKIYIISLLLIANIVFAQSVDDDSLIHKQGPNKEVAEFQNSEKIEIFRVKIVNDEMARFLHQKIAAILGNCWDMCLNILKRFQIIHILQAGGRSYHR